MATGWQPPQRALAHQVFGAVLPAAGGGLADAQTHSVLSALWHEVHAESICLAVCHRAMCWICDVETVSPAVLAAVDRDANSPAGLSSPTSSIGEKCDCCDGRDALKANTCAMTGRLAVPQADRVSPSSSTDPAEWPQVAEEGDTPALFAAMAAMLDAVVSAASDAALLAIARFLISLRADAVDDETGR